MPIKKETSFLIYLFTICLTWASLSHAKNSIDILTSENVGGTLTWEKEFRLENPFRIPRRALAAIATKRCIYILGGVDQQGKYVETTEYAKILDDGKLSHWKNTTSIKEKRLYHDAFYFNNFIYVAGGGSGPLGSENVPIASVERAEVFPSCSLSEWKTVNYLTTPRRGLKIVQSKNMIYATGGYDGRFLKTTERATINKANELSKWKTETARFISDRYIHSATQIYNYIYLLGGHVKNENKMSYSTVESSRFDIKGHLTPWRTQLAKLLTPRFIASSFELNHFLFLLGGHDGQSRLNIVESAAVAKNGAISTWDKNTSLPIPISATSTAKHKNRIYILGGISNNGILNTVLSAVSDSKGQLGNWKLKK